MIARWIAGSVMAAWLLSCAAITHSRAMIWRDDVTLWTDATQLTPLQPRPWVNLGKALGDAGQVDEARTILNYAIRVSHSSTLDTQTRAFGEAMADLNLAGLEGDRVTRCLRIQHAIQTAPILLIARQLSAFWSCA